MKTTQKYENTGHFMDRTAERIANRILETQQRTADFLNRKASGQPSGVLKSYLFIFCFLFGLACFWIVLSTVWLPSKLVKADDAINESIGAPSEISPDTAYSMLPNTKK